MSTGGPASEKTLLDEFAGQALTGLLSSPNLLSALIDESETDETPKPIAIKAYEMAESMLAEKARREADVQESSTTQDDGNVAEPQEANRELLEALSDIIELIEVDLFEQGFESSPSAQSSIDHSKAIISQHKGAA